MELRCPQCKRTFTPKRPHQIYDDRECRYQGWIEREVEAASQRVEPHALVEVRGQQEEGGASADYLILAREQIARTLLGTGYFTADDLEPLGIPQQYRRSVHGSATGYFSGDKLYMEEAGLRKSERPTRKGGKNTVFRITVKGRRELPRLLKGMAGPVAEASERLYGGTLVGIGAGDTPLGRARQRSDLSAPCVDSGESPSSTGKGPAHSHGATLDRPALPQSNSPSGARLSHDAVTGEQGSSAGSTLSGRQLPAGEPASQLFETEPAAVETRSAWTDSDVAEAA